MQNQELSPVVRRAAAAGRAMALAIATLLCVSAGTATAATTYKLEILENLPNREPLGFPTAINANGQVIGVMGSSDGTDTPVYWNTSGQITDLSLPSDVYGTTTLGGINKAGDVVVNNGDGTRTYLWNAGVLRDLTAGYAFAINDLGQLVGYFGSGLSLWTNGILTPLVGFGGVVAMNNNAELIGSVYFPALQGYRALLWRNGTVIDLGTLPGDNQSFAKAINDLGQVVGYSYNNISGAPVRAFLWENGVMTDLGLPARIARPGGINNLGQVVGEFESGGLLRAFILQNGIMTDLTPVLLGLENCHLTGINDAGQIVGSCRPGAVSVTQAFRLTPAQGVDIGLSMTVGGSNLVGQPMVFTATVANVGGQAATGVEFKDTLPAGFNVTSVSASQGTCSGTAVISCALGDIAVGANATVQITVTPTVIGIFENLASVNATEQDANTLNNSITFRIDVYPASTDLAVFMSDSPDPVRRGANLTYFFNVSNKGPAPTSGVSLSDKLPSSMKFVSVQSSQGSCAGTSSITCTLGYLASGASAYVTLVVQPQLTGKYTNSVSIGSTTPDSNSGNNSASVVTTVVR